jgi:hypothetical protein
LFVDFELQGSDDNQTWTSIDAQSGLLLQIFDSLLFFFVIFFHFIMKALCGGINEYNAQLAELTSGASGVCLLLLFVYLFVIILLFITIMYYYLLIYYLLIYYLLIYYLLICYFITVLK